MNIIHWKNKYKNMKKKYDLILEYILIKLIYF